MAIPAHPSGMIDRCPGYHIRRDWRDLGDCPAVIPRVTGGYSRREDITNLPLSMSSGQSPPPPDRLFQRLREGLARQGVLDGLAVNRRRHAGIVTQHAQGSLTAVAGATNKRPHV